MSIEQTDSKYLELITEAIRTSGDYKPKFGQKVAAGGLTLAQFQALYQSDPFYNWFGLDNPLLYAAHKAAGGMTSIYRQIGIGCERLFRAIIKDSFELDDADIVWAYETTDSSGRTRKLLLDGRITADRIINKANRSNFRAWMQDCAGALDIDPSVFTALTGVVFEVRQGYKSKDSKRQNADIVNAAVAYTKSYLPCIMVLSTQIDHDVLVRYRSQKWVVLTGIDGTNDPLQSTYDFMRDIVGYDLAAFFRRNSKAIREQINSVLDTLLSPGAGQ